MKYISNFYRYIQNKYRLVSTKWVKYDKICGAIFAVLLPLGRKIPGTGAAIISGIIAIFIIITLRRELEVEFRLLAALSLIAAAFLSLAQTYLRSLKPTSGTAQLLSHRSAISERAYTLALERLIDEMNEPPDKSTVTYIQIIFWSIIYYSKTAYSFVSRLIRYICRRPIMLTITIGLIISIYVVISSIQISNGSKDSIDEAKHGGFAQHLADAGYELTEIKMNVGLIPDVTSTYKMVRELSEADRRAVERTLKIEDRRNPGFFADLRRQIIRTLLAVSATGEMRVSTLHVGVLPLPSADFTIESPDRPMADDLQGLLRAIKSECRPQPEQHAPARGERR